MHFYYWANMFIIKRAYLILNSKCQTWFQILTVTITVHDNGCTSLKSFYSSVKWEWWYSNPKYLTELAYTSKKTHWELLARIAFLAYDGSSPSFTFSCISHFLPNSYLPIYSTLTKTRHVWYMRLGNKIKPFKIMLHIGKWHWTEAGIQAQKNIPLYTCKEKKFNIEINNFCFEKMKRWI